MKKLLVVLLTLSMVIGMFSFAAFADQENNSRNSTANSSVNENANSEKGKNNEDGQDSKNEVRVVPSMDFNANSMKALLNKDAALDRSVGNTEDNSDKVWGSYLKDFKHSSENRKNPKFSSKLEFSGLNAKRLEANRNWVTINGLNKEIKKAFDKYRASLRVLTRTGANAAMANMNAELNTLRDVIAKAHVEIKRLRSLKDIQWKAFRAAVKAGEFDKAQIALDSSSLTVLDIVDLKGLIIKEQEKIISAKTSILEALRFTPGKVPAVPTFSPKAGAVLTGTSITIKSPGAKVFYTTNAAIVLLNPSTLTEYTGKFLLIEPTTTVRAIAYKNGVSSTPGTAVYYVQDYATAPTSYAITVGAIGTTLTGPAAGATSKAAISGWVKDGTIKFTVVDGPSIQPTTPANSIITINGRLYTSGESYPMTDIRSNHASYHHLVIVVTTRQTDKITAVRTFMIQIKK